MAVECVLIVPVKLGDGGDAVCARYWKQRPRLNGGWREMVLAMEAKSVRSVGHREFLSKASAKQYNE